VLHVKETVVKVGCYIGEFAKLLLVINAFLALSPYRLHVRPTAKVETNSRFNSIDQYHTYTQFRNGEGLIFHSDGDASPSRNWGSEVVIVWMSTGSVRSCRNRARKRQVCQCATRGCGCRCAVASWPALIGFGSASQ